MSWHPRGRHRLTLELTPEEWAPIKVEAKRQARSTSWILQTAWLLAKDRLALVPTAPKGKR